MGLAILVLLVVAGGSLLISLRPTPSPIPRSIREQAGYPLYYPTELVGDYRIDRGSMSLSSQIVSFVAKDTSGHTMNFTLQPRPRDFDYASFYNKSLLHSFVFAAPEGQAAIGKGDQLMIGSLLSDTTLVLISGDSSQLTSGELQTVITHLKKD